MQPAPLAVHHVGVAVPSIDDAMQRAADLGVSRQHGTKCRENSAVGGQHAGVKTMYTVSVTRDARTGGLWLYLPGRGEPGYALNVRTILRDTQDGRWHRPSPAWASALAKYLP